MQRVLETARSAQAMGRLNNKCEQDSKQTAATSLQAVVVSLDALAAQHPHL